MRGRIRHMEATSGYQVTFNGQLRHGFEPAQVRQALSEKLKLTEKQLAALFGGEPQVLKQTESADDAKKWVSLLAKLGIIAYIQKPDEDVQNTNKPSITLPRFSPLRKGPKLIAALVVAASAEITFILLYVALLLSFSVGLIYSNLFTTWGESVTGVSSLGLLLQALAMVAGIIVLFLLAKPFWAFNPKHYQGIAVTAKQEPLLHAFVADVCERINAPMPHQIRITNNTSIELNYLGGLSGFVRNRCVLTIGAPVVALCDASQLAALIAQSLKLLHSKSLSPHAAWLLRICDSWLQRAIYGTDRIDRYLVSLRQAGGIRSAFVAALQRLIILSRHILGWRLQLSRRLNHCLMHRLVADADKVSLVFTGSEGFQQLMKQQRLLTFASQNTLPELMKQWRKAGELPDDLIHTLALHCQNYPDGTLQKLRQEQEKMIAATRDPIPADSQRLRRVSRVEVSAAYDDHRKANELFHNFPKLSRAMTLRLYYNRFAIPVSPQHLTSSAPTSEPQKQQQQQLDAIFNGFYIDLIPLKLGHRMRMAGNYNEALSLRDKALGATGNSHSQLVYKRCRENELALLDVTTQKLLYDSGLWKQWELPAENKAGVLRIQQSCLKQEKLLAENIGLLAQQLKPHVERLGAALALLNTAEAAHISNTQSLQEEVHTLLEVLERIEQIHEPLRSLRLHTSLLNILLNHTDKRNAKLQQHIQQQSNEIKQLLTGLGASLKTTPKPFGGGHTSLMDFAIGDALTDDSHEGNYDRAQDVVEKIIHINRHILARLCAIALHVEDKLKLNI